MATNIGGCLICIKYLMFGFNFLFWLVGCAIIGVGIWVRVDPDFAQYTGDDPYNLLFTGAYILIALGIVIMIIGFLGCCGAIRESQCMLIAFFIFLFSIFAVLLSCGIWGVVAKEDLKQKVKATLEAAIDDYHTNEAAKQLMDNIQTNFDCCGVGILSYGLKPPDTCGAIYTTVAKKGCDTALFDYFNKNLMIVAGVAIGVGLIMLLGMMFAMMLCCAIRDL